MKKNERNMLSIEKLTIAKLSSTAMRNINGGDCLPTEHYGDPGPTTEIKHIP
ncbi:class I lanthipeptide [Sungkyunkwania multivorans]|uniref:Class I lanthipeptide n=1 Tax=Sungkyunkwania multivorans TaxID=1173618 RepID=A0ABW3D074_9FLAO